MRGNSRHDSRRSQRISSSAGIVRLRHGGAYRQDMQPMSGTSSIAFPVPPVTVGQETEVVDALIAFEENLRDEYIAGSRQRRIVAGVPQFDRGAIATTDPSAHRRFDRIERTFRLEGRVFSVELLSNCSCRFQHGMRLSGIRVAPQRNGIKIDPCRVVIDEGAGGWRPSWPRRSLLLEAYKWR